MITVTPAQVDPRVTVFRVERASLRFVQAVGDIEDTDIEKDEPVDELGEDEGLDSEIQLEMTQSCLRSWAHDKMMACQR
jgi:hypothetical protein